MNREAEAAKMEARVKERTMPGVTEIADNKGFTGMAQEKGFSGDSDRPEGLSC